MSKVESPSPILRNLMTELFPDAYHKSRNTRIRIIEGALKAYSKHGFENCGFAEVARAARVSRPLVMHYFASLESLFDLSMKYVRARMLQFIVDEIREARDPRDRLRRYIHAHFRWLEEDAQYASLWPQFYSKCSVSKAHRALNTDLVNIGQDRIQALLEEGIHEGAWRVWNIAHASKMIQALITGTVVGLLTENSRLSPPELEDALFAAAMAMLPAPSDQNGTGITANS